MPKIALTAEAHRAIRSLASNNLNVTGVRQPDGSYVTPISEPVLTAIYAKAHRGETISETITRMIATQKGKH